MSQVGSVYRFDGMYQIWVSLRMSKTQQDDPMTPKKVLSPAAKRALAEAEERRKAQLSQRQSRPNEKSGPKGAEPTRYGDWERGGIAYDF